MSLRSSAKYYRVELFRHLELVTVLSSNLFGLDDYIRTYLLEHPDISFSTAIKIILRYYTTTELIVQLVDFKNHLKSVDFCLFQEIFGKKVKGCN